MNTMKEFLKPNRWKVGIFSAIVIITVLIVWRSIGACKWGCPPLWTALVTIFFPFASPLWENTIVEILAPIGIILEFPYLYLLACLIYFIFSKVRNLKK